MLLSEAAGVWSTGVHAVMPANANPGMSFGSLSCASARDCAAVGDYRDSSGHNQGLLLSAAAVSPILTVSVPASGTVGTPIDPSALIGRLSGGADPWGTLVFTVFGPQASPPSACASSSSSVGAAAVSGDGSYTPASGFTAARAGTYWWYASYSGDNSDNPVASTCGAGMAHTEVSQRGGGAPVSVRFVGSPRSTGKGALFALRCLAPAAQRCRTDDTLTSTETLAGGKPIAVSAARRAKRLKRTIVLGRKRVIISAGRAQAITIPSTPTAGRCFARSTSFRLWSRSN
ncbi:MAG TPA: hypothetical protein VMU39_07815 [Solirubrobacteraceae bacterium]|nr:hypothetical protein [Solirubrobacteraceae bacterium]